MQPPSSFSRCFEQTLCAVGFALVLTTAACNKAGPSGQTVATVNGDAITQSELNLELELSGASSANWKTLGPQALQVLIDRKLLVQAAKHDGIDKQPDVVLAGERAKDTTIVNRALQSVAAGLRQPVTASDAEAYLSEHPSLSSDRRILSVEQIRFQMPKDAGLIAALRPAKTMPELTGVLIAREIPYQRATAEIDSASLEDKARHKLMATASGEPALVLEGATAIANHVMGVRPVGVGATAATDLAKQRLIAERVEQGLRQRQAALRNSAKIEYSKEFAPKQKSSR